MKKQLTIRRTMLAMAIAALTASGSALAVGTFESPQPLEVGEGGMLSVAGTIEPGTDVDFYSFFAKAGNEITIDIDGTHLGANPEHDVIIYVFGPNGIWIPQNDTEALDNGSLQAPAVPVEFPYTLDPNVKLIAATDGVWKVAVASYPRLVDANGTISGMAGSTGPYTLNVMGVPLPATTQAIEIDIKPGNKEFSVLNPSAKGVIPVAILSNKDFLPFSVDVATLTFGRTGDEPSLVRCLKEGRDLNGDGTPDRICHFDNEKAKFNKTSATAKVKGKAGGKAFEGLGSLKVVPRKYSD